MKLNLRNNKLSRSFIWCIFYGICVLVSACLLDTSLTNSGLFANIRDSFNIPAIDADYRGWLVVFFTTFLLLVNFFAILLEKNLAAKQGKDLSDDRWFIISLITGLGLFILMIQVDVLSLLPLTLDSFKNAMIFLGSSYLFGLFLFIVLTVVILAIYYFLRKIIKDSIKDNINNQASLETINNQKLEEGENNMQTKEEVFPGLCYVDSEFENKKPLEIKNTEINLKDFVSLFRLYLAQEEKLYFDETILREFIAGMASSHLIILEGLSGTGKSSLARYISSFIGEQSYFESVQASWHDNTAILGYYNDFSKKYKETEFLKRLYEFTYRPNEINIMVLDEVNISRIEYYFADFLSILEYPTDLWKVKIMELPFGFVPPYHLQNGFVKIPNNTWFIGTANKDDSTYTITDKVYDRAISISFNNINIPFEVKEEIKPLHISYDYLNNLFNEAKNNKNYQLSSKDIEDFQKITNYIYDTFDIAFGNRVWNQIITFVPVFIACGGTKLEALDFLLARKYLYKLQGRYESYIKPGVLNLKNMISSTYGNNNFKQTNRLLDNIIRKL